MTEEALLLHRIATQLAEILGELRQMRRQQDGTARDAQERGRDRYDLIGVPGTEYRG